MSRVFSLTETVCLNPSVSAKRSPQLLSALVPNSLSTGFHLCLCDTRDLYNHLGDTVTAQGLAANECLSLDACKAVADRRKKQENSRGDERRAPVDTAHELDDGHDKIGGGTHVVCRNSADEGVELAGGRADAQQERDFDEQDQEGRGTLDLLAARFGRCNDDGGGRTRRRRR